MGTRPEFKGECMQAERTYRFRTKVYGNIDIRARTYDGAMEAFLRQGYAETDIEEVC